MRLVDFMIAALILAALAATVLVLNRGEEARGAVTVVDGDSLRMNGRELRLSGIDAPELHQTCMRDAAPWPCGEAAKERMRVIAEGAVLQCRLSGRDRYGRDLARCEARGRDIGAAMVSEGLAVAYGGYEREERRARDLRLGIWAGTFDRPSDWRRAHPRPLAAPRG